MKKRVVIMLIMALSLLFCASALAEDASGRGVLALQRDGLAAYVDGSGNLMIPGSDEPVSSNGVEAIVSIDPYRLAYFVKVQADGIERTDLAVMDLSTFEEQVVAQDVYAACMAGSDALYYIPSADRTQLYCINLPDGQAQLVYTAQEALSGLYESADGLVATYVEDAGAVIYAEDTGSFEPFGDPIPTKTRMVDGYQVYIAGGDLYIRHSDSLGADLVDANVFDFALQDGKVYYLANTGSATRVKVYDPAALEQKVLLTPEVDLDFQIAASQNSLFVLGLDDVVYRVNAEAGTLEAFLDLGPLETQGDEPGESYSILAMNGLLNVYAAGQAESEEPVFTFMEYATDLNEEDGQAVLVQSVALEGEETAWTMLQPAVQYTPLSRGSRGDAVSAIQQPLYDHGYYDYYIDGIFGSRTDRAVRLLQGDLGMEVTGVADEELQRTILSGDFPEYDPYLPQAYGARGLRVQEMQQRLRSLGYLADSADGIFGVRTQEAVQLFQTENNLTVSDDATRETLVELYDPNASQCSSYINLRQGDSGYRVRALNKRLKQVFYL